MAVFAGAPKSVFKTAIFGTEVVAAKRDAKSKVNSPVIL
jgi:hypothetical protein